jgi:hypothetical protein
MQKACLALVFALAFLGFGSTASHAHSPGESYVFLEFKDDAIDGRFEFRYEDLKEKLGIDVMENGTPSLDRLKASAPQVLAYIDQGFSIGPVEGAPYVLAFAEPSLFDAEGGWAQFNFRIESGPIPPELAVRYEMGYENDRTHRGLLVLEWGTWPAPDYRMQMAMVFSASNSSQVLDTQNPPELMTPLHMIWQGVLHIWIGIDHILFLLVLALPIVLVKAGQSWQPAPALGPSLFSLFKIVTVFTIAHSITLVLASLEIITLPSRLVESIIALSIILVGLNNVFGRSHNTSLIVILLLGLFHGLGFASVMGELPFRISELRNFILIILGFNLGVELGQLVILLVVFPVLFALRRMPWYSTVVLKGGSIALILIAGYWFIERAFAL